MLTDAAATMRARCAAQLYDGWHGYYMLRRIVDYEEIVCRPVNPRDEPIILRYQTEPRYIDVRPLDRDEAMTIRLRADEALELKWTKTNITGGK